MAFVVVHGLVSRVQRVSYSLIGSCVNTAEEHQRYDEDADDELFDDEHGSGSAQVEMLPQQPSTGSTAVHRNPPRALPLRRVLSNISDHPQSRSRGRHHPLRRRSFGSFKSSFLGGGSSGTRGGGMPSPLPLRRTLSAGTVIPRAASAFAVEEEGPSTTRPLRAHNIPPPAAIRRIPLSQSSSLWTPAAERALSQTLDPDRLLYPPLPTRATLVSNRRTTSLGTATINRNMDMNPITTSPVGEFRHVFRQEMFDGHDQRDHHSSSLVTSATQLSPPPMPRPPLSFAGTSSPCPHHPGRRKQTGG